MSAVTDTDRWMSVDELAAAAGVAVRTVRFYTGKKLLPPPRLEGRTGYYGAHHLSRLELIGDLQDHGYTLAAVESFLERLPTDADPDEVAMFRALVAPWTPDVVELDVTEIERRLGRPATADDLDFLGIRHPGPGPHAVSLAAVGLLRELGSSDIPDAMYARSRALIDVHAQSLADELQELFRETVLRPYYAGPRGPAERARVQTVATQLRQVTGRALVLAFERAIDDLIRESVAGPAAPSDESITERR